MLRTSDEAADGDESGIEDDRLRLMFTCCHPALPVEAQVALTLRSLAGLTTRAFLVPHETMAKRLTRAKRKITEARSPYRVPAAHRLGERLRAVLSVIYALFNEGYGASAGDELIRKDLCAEAIRLGRLLAELMPDEPEALGLLSLMPQAGRTTSRPGRSRRRAGDPREPESEPLGPGRDRGGMHRARSRCAAAKAGPLPVAGGDRGLPRARRSAAETDWHEIAVLYDRLSEIVPTPVVLLNRAVAVAMAQGPAAGLALVEELEQAGALVDYYLLPATRADLLRRLSRYVEAATAYRRALELAPTEAERRFLRRRLSELSEERHG